MAISRFSYKYIFAAALLAVGLLFTTNTEFLANLSFPKLIITWLLLFFTPGYLLLDLTFREKQLDWLEMIAISFGFSLAFLTIPILVGFGLGFNIQSIAYLTLVSVAIETVLIFFIENRHAEKRTGVNWNIDAQKILFAILILIAVFIVVKLGTQMVAVGDNKVHLGRIRRILELPSLSPSALVPFKDGGLHPGYAYPFWHLLLALLSKISGIDPVLLWWQIHPLLTIVSLSALYAFVNVLFKNKVLSTISVFAYLAPFFTAEEPLKLWRSLVHPSEFSMIIIAFIILTTILHFLTGKQRNYLLLGLTILLLVDQALIHVTNLFFLFVVLSGFLVTLILVGTKKRESLLRLAPIVLAAMIIGSLYFGLVYTPVSISTENFSPSLSPGRYLQEGRVYPLETGLYIAGPGYYIGAKSFLALLFTLLLLPLLKKKMGVIFVVSNMLVVLFVIFNPWLFTFLSRILSLSQMVRFAGQVWYYWIIHGLIIYTLLAYSTNIWSKFREDQKPWLGLPLAIILAGGYFVPLLGSERFFALLLNQIIIYMLGLALFSIILTALILELRLKTSRDTTLLGELLHQKLNSWLVALFVLFFFLYLSPQIPRLSESFQTAPPRPTDPLEVEGYNYLWSRGLIEFVRNQTPSDSVFLSDSQTSETLTAFVSRYVASYPSGHMSAPEAGDNPRTRLNRTLQVFFPELDLSTKLEILKQYQVDYILVNANVVPPRFAASVKQLPNLKIVYEDGTFTVYQAF